MLHAHVILNPAAGRGAARRALDPVCRAFRAQGWAVDVSRTERPGHAVELAAQASGNGARHVVAVGGDGTVHEVANGLLGAGSDAALGVVPIGSGNDFAKLVGVYRHDPGRSVARLVTAAPRRFDVGRALGEWFVNSMGFGFGPAVVRTRNAMPGLRGFLSYLVPVLRAFATFRPPRFDVRTDGFAERGYMMMVEVCNGTTAGGSYRFAPDADPTDGQLDVCLIRRVSLPRFLLAIPRVMRGTHGGMSEVAQVRTAKLVIRSLDEPLLLHLDGELREPGVNECTVRIEPKKLTVLVAR
ncbi:MAG TPA: diacylglycerol kinase family protein [Gemmatimonadales bacterium]|nr:diacylglycerol kinase family protein [Gemmatimonadales bacterium]